MTRFARAKGSKASNERREEEATPWHVMRQQLAEQLSNHQAQNDTNIQSYNLKEILSSGANTQKEEIWSDFGNTNSQVKSNSKKINSKTCEINKSQVNNGNEPFENLSKRERHVKGDYYLNEKVHVEANEIGVSDTFSLKNRKLENKSSLRLNDKSKKKVQTKNSVSSMGTNLSVEKRKKSIGNLMKRENEERHAETKDTVTPSKKLKLTNIGKEVESGKLGISKKKKDKILHGKNAVPVGQKNSSVGLQDFYTLNNAGSNQEYEYPSHVNKSKKIAQSNSTEIQNTKNNLDELLNISSNETKTSENTLNNSFSSQKQKNSNYSINNNKLFRNSADCNFHNNRYIENHFTNDQRQFQTIIANGREIRVAQYQGFLIKKDDAEELKKLRKKLKAQHIPKEKLETIMKLERRKAEKALTREKKKVCYHCRQFGHNFSDCPEINNSHMVKTGLCFKCGSLEHSHYECKVLQHQEFRHAVCFVCKEQGHIARQCPLNSQGLYPRGGSCHLCGEVTHLRKDCPKAIEENTSNSVTVDTLKDGIVEGLGGKSTQQKRTENAKKKVIKFI